VQPDDTICYCFHVSKRKIVNYIRVHKPRVASEVSQCGGAGTGCGWCIPFLKKYFEEARRDRQAETDAADAAETITPAEYARQRGNYIRAGHGTPPPGATPPPPE
jgi:NAD(P)H-nitrite reductase large subunit